MSCKFLALLYCLVASVGCVEYRFDRLNGQDRYIGWVRTRPKLDPKLGSKGKMYTGIKGPVQPYIGGHFSRRRLTMNMGIIYYLSDSASLEFGYKTEVFTTDDKTFGSDTGRITWHDNDDDKVFYFGGKINF